MGSTVFLRRISNHDVSFSERPVALRTVGRVEGHPAPFGMYPLGAFGKARTSSFVNASAPSASKDLSLGSKKDADGLRR